MSHIGVFPSFCWHFVKERGVLLLLKDAIMEYELACKVRRLSQGTIDNYDRQLRYMRRYLEDECAITRLEDEFCARLLLQPHDQHSVPV